MNSKILIAFASGALIASGIVYVAVRKDLDPRPASVAAKPVPPVAAAPAVAPPAVVQPAASTPAPSTPAASAPAPAPAAVASHVRVNTTTKTAPKPASAYREKPSPFASQAARKETAESQPPADANSPIGEPTRPHDPAPPAEAHSVPEPAPAIEPQVPPAPAEPARAPQPAPPPRPRVVLTPAPQDPETTPDNPPQAQRDPNAPPSVTIARGTMIPVRIGETISAAHYGAGDTFLATLDRPLVIDGWVIAERGSRLEGRVVQSTSAGHGNGTSHLEIELTKLSTADGQHVPIRTEVYSRDGSSSAGGDLAKVGIGTAIGAAIGAAAGGGKGAAIGAGIGAGAGVAGAVITRSKPAEIPVETRISFRVADPVTITERAN